MSEKSVKVLSVCISDLVGGAARAAYRIHQSQRMLGVDSRMLVKKKCSGDNNVLSLNSFLPQGKINQQYILIKDKVSKNVQRHRLKRYPKREDVSVSDLQGCCLHGALRKLDYSVLHLHWINQLFVSIDQLPKDRPIVWTLHDSWAFCGVCHCFLECTRYEAACGNCPLLHSGKENDLSHQVWKKKMEVYKHLNLHIVAPSQWLGECAKKSSLLRQFPVTVIPNCLDVDEFRPYQEDELSSRWAELRANKSNKKYLLFGAFHAVKDRIKGFKYLVSALKVLETQCDDIELIVFGANKSELELELSIPIHYVGYVGRINDLVSLYNIADVMVVPSLSETFCQTASESMACELPVVAFRCTGIQEVVDHGVNGYLAEPWEGSDLANGIRWCLDNNEGNRLGKAGRKKVMEKYTYEIVGKQYKQLYESVLSKPS